MFNASGKDGSLGGGKIVSLYEDTKDTLWAIGKNGIWKWKPGPPKFYPLPFGTDYLVGITEDDAGKLLIGMEGGIRRFFDGKSRRFRCPAACRLFPPEQCSATMTAASGSLCTMRA